MGHEKNLSLTQILDLLHNSYVYMDFTCTEIKTEIWIVVFCHNKNVQLWLFFVSEAQNFLNDIYVCMCVADIGEN